jgi:phage gpG-like protein
MPRLTAATNAADVAADFGEMEHRARHMLPANRVNAQHLRNGILRNFRREGFFPYRWKKSRAAARRGGKTLTHHATLRNSMHPVATDRYAAAGSDLVYAAIHEYGGRCGRHGATVLPPRAYLPIDAQGRLEPRMGKRIAHTTETWITEGKVK